MPFVVKLTCQGTAQRAHPVRTVAQFRYDDGWARIHDRVKQDLIGADDDGELVMRHLIACDHPACIRAKPRYISGDRLYPALDYKLRNGETELHLR